MANAKWIDKMKKSVIRIKMYNIVLKYMQLNLYSIYIQICNRKDHGHTQFIFLQIKKILNKIKAEIRVN